MAACPETSRCLFYKKYKGYAPAEQAFIDHACANNLPCARKMYFKSSGKQAPADMSPAGTYISKNK